MAVLAETRELAEIIEARMLGQDGATMVRPELLFARVAKAMPRMPALYRSALCVVVQGSKRVHVGAKVYRYDAERYLVSALTLPVDCELVSSPDHPLLSLAVELDPHHLGALIAETTTELHSVDGRPHEPMCNGVLDRPMARALLRLAEASSSDREWGALGEGALREVYFRLLSGPASALLRDRVAKNGSIELVARAVQFIENNLAEHLDIAAIAKAAAVSASGLHARFKEVTAQSPMQFVKRLRLEQAKSRIALGDSVTETALRVGYVSASQFSRDFRRHFGVPPSKTRPAVAIAV